MKFVLSLVLILIFVYPTAANDKAFPVTDGNSLEEALRLGDRIQAKQTLTKEETAAYFSVLGYLQGQLGMGMAWSRLGLDAPFKLPRGITVGQLQQIVVKFLSDHPEKLHEAADPLVLAALTQAFPSQDVGK